MEKVCAFLKKYKMFYKDIDFTANCEVFVSEMRIGLSSKKSSLAMIPTYIETDQELPLNESVIVLDIGGTNTRVAVVHFDTEKKPIIEDFARYAIPGTDCEVSKGKFFEKIASYLEPIIDKANKIGICFSYPAEPLPNKDGRVLKLTKQLKADRLVGENVGGGIFEALLARHCTKKVKAVVINDSVATLFGGKAAFFDRNFDSYVGFILGTGTNTSYIENNSNITKVETPKISDNMVINIESGGYSRFHSGILDKDYDAGLADRGAYQFEKMVSGRYQGRLLLSIVQKAAQEGLFSSRFAEKIMQVSNLESYEVDKFLYYPFADNRLAQCCKTEDQVADRITLY
jgi:hexokinase